MNEALAVRGYGNYLDDAFDTDFSQGLLHFRCTSGRYELVGRVRHVERMGCFPFCARSIAQESKKYHQAILCRFHKRIQKIKKRCPHGESTA